MEPRAADRCFLGDVGFWVERTPVHEAAQRGESLQLQQLIESGACVNQVTVDSITPLHAASLQGQAQCVQLLLAAGAQGGKSEIWTMERLCLWYGFHITPAMKLGTQPTGHLGHRGVCRREGRRRWKCCIQNN